MLFILDTTSKHTPCQMVLLFRPTGENKAQNYGYKFKTVQRKVLFLQNYQGTQTNLIV
jgi:hypothetical protein